MPSSSFLSFGVVVSRSSSLRLAFMCKDPCKEVVVVSPKVETDGSVGISMMGRFWDVMENVAIKNYFGKREVRMNESY
jgi:isocitrate dehydrogenase